ncbi:putative exopolysaccharide production protein ExoZ [Novosphingobium sp. Rr 2-17]|uniref:acyltransferase family protein n=1 Tax=Novosphingobium sp. Rr 2-17 TaxID=555793 RepID=UPI0002698205|nr:acyltransferase [Novosphingobium sp. Rr 2-17]EIZ79029.1 putative exopolysaccharide production protein ExoZ [Novosphingobium sp. Rr 2-17]
MVAPKVNANRLDGVQYLRGLCALLVVISHCNGILGKPEYYSKMALPDLHLPSVFAVAAFFSISGFIIVVSSLDSSFSPRHPRREFARRRLVRIIPFLWLCTLGYNALSWLGTGTLEPEAIMRTLFLWPAGEPKPNVVWSLRNEMLFYLLFAWALLGPCKRFWPLGLALALSTAFYLLAFDLGLATPFLGHVGFDALKTFMGSDYGANFQFAAGAAVAWAYLRGDKTKFASRISAVWMVAAMALAGLAILAFPMAQGLAICLIWSTMAAAILILAVSARPAPGRLGQFGLVLGNASFSIYLVHNAVVLVLLAMARIAHLQLDTQTERLAFLFTSVMLATAAGVIVHYLIEAPLIRFCERRTRPSGSEPAAVLVDDRQPGPS